MKYLTNALILVLFVSLGFSTWGQISAYGFSDSGNPGLVTYPWVYITHNSGSGGVRITEVTINLPSSSHISYSGPTTVSVNSVICAPSESSCMSQYGASTDIPVNFNALTFDAETPENVYYITYTIKGNNVNCLPILGCSIESTTRTWTTGTLSWVDISGPTESETQAQQDQEQAQTQASNAISQATSAISQASSAKSSAQSYVNSAGSSCTQAQTSFSDGGDELDNANSYKTQANSYYNSGDYSGAKDKADDSTAAANAAKSDFNSAKTYAQNCLNQQQAAEEQEQRNRDNANNAINDADSSKRAASANVTAAGAQCTDAQNNWNNGLSKLQDAESKYASRDYTGAKTSADSAKVYFNNAKTAAQSCIAENSLQRNAADLARTAANAKITSAQSLVNQAESRINSSGTLRCIDLSGATEKLNSAKTKLNSAMEDMRNSNTAYNATNYPAAQTDANTAQQLATDAISNANASISDMDAAIQSANQSVQYLQNAETAVARARDLKSTAAGMNVSDSAATSLLTSANDYLTIATTGCQNAEYTVVQSNSNIAIEKANQASSEFETAMDEEIQQRLDDLTPRVNHLRTNVAKYSIDYDTYELESELHAIEAGMDSGNYAQMTNRLNALSGRVDDAETLVASEVKKEQDSQMMTYLLIGGGVVLVGTLGVAAFYVLSRLKANGKEKKTKSEDED